MCCPQGVARSSREMLQRVRHVMPGDILFLSCFSVGHPALPPGAGSGAAQSPGVAHRPQGDERRASLLRPLPPQERTVAAPDLGGKGQASGLRTGPTSPTGADRWAPRVFPSPPGRARHLETGGWARRGRGHTATHPNRFLILKILIKRRFQPF